MLTLEQARRQALWLAVAGWVLGLASVLLLVVTALKGIYAASSASPLTAPIERMIAALYRAAADIAPSLTAWIWRTVPDLDLSVSLLSTRNWGFLFIYALLIGSVILRGRAARIRRALAEHEARMQQFVWEEQVRHQIRGGASAEEAKQGLDIRISLSNVPTPWHQGFWGVVVLGIVLPLAVDIIKASTGFLK